MIYDFYLQSNAEKVERVIEQLTYKDGWIFSIFSHNSNTVSIFELRISLDVTASISLVSSKKTIQMLVNHPFSVPNYPMDDREAERWLLDCILLVEQHEACKHFRIGGDPLYYQNHGEDGSSYRITRKR